MRCREHVLELGTRGVPEPGPDRLDLGFRQRHVGVLGLPLGELPGEPVVGEREVAVHFRLVLHVVGVPGGQIVAGPPPGSRRRVDLHRFGHGRLFRALRGFDDGYVARLLDWFGRGLVHAF